jgi:hypothetical protein
MTKGRRGFLGDLVTGSAALGITSGLGPARWATESPEEPEIITLARQWESDVEQDKPVWDMSWVERIAGDRRQVFDGPEIAEGTVLHQARTFMQGYIDVYGAKDPDLSAVIVIRHAAIPIAVNDLLWNELELGKEFKLKDPESGKPARRNPFLNANAPSGAKYAMLWPDGGLDTLIKRGAIALCCNLALFRIVSLIMKREKLEAQPARAKAIANLVPGVINQPSGIFAVARAQQAGCHYIQSG